VTASIAVVGGGLAGVAAARELAHAGEDVVLLEARDRLGGRTWTDNRLGRPLEMGAMHVHWLQPCIWSEIVRYGIELKPPRAVDHASWFVDGSLHSGSFSDLWDRMDRALTPLFAQARDVFPNPHDSAAERDLVESLDHVVITDRIEELDLTAEERGLAHAYCTLQFNGRADEGAYTQMLRWVALAGGDWRLLSEALAGYELAGGTTELVTAMHDDGRFPIRFGAFVETIDAADRQVTIGLAGGDTVSARAVIVAVPLNTLGAIRFTPGLPGGVARVAEAGQVSRGSKIWVRVAGRVESWCAFAEDHPIVFAYTDTAADQESMVVCFGRDGEELVGDDPAAVQAALEVLLPGVEVVECASHDWRSDPLTRQTWGMLRPGQWTQLRDLELLSGPVLLAGSDVAAGWAGLMEGAVESGLSAARRACACLAGGDG
jgi:monoamine oxidase